VDISEVASIRQRIALECEALQRMVNDFQITGSHDIINKKFSALTPLHEQLSSHVGEQEATRIAVETYIRYLG
jgi:hypothetical protein